MRILQIITSMDPRGGGAAEAVLQSSLYCARLGHHMELLTLDAVGPTSLASVPLTIHKLGPTRSAYAYTNRLIPWLREHARSYDAVVVHGLWQFHIYAVWRALAGGATPYYVFPHGMLDPWFNKTYPTKRLKKMLFWPWAEYRALRDARAVLFTCEEERRLARKSFWPYRANEVVAEFGTSAPPIDEDRSIRAFQAAFPALKGNLIILFLGRLHEKKGCDLLIEAFARICGADARLHLVMAGPNDRGYQSGLEALARARGVSQRISWVGMLAGDLKWGALRSSMIFALPSHQENFGIAVVEALACGLPVLLSDKVNIWREIVADGAGLVAQDTIDGTEACLRQWLALSDEEKQRMRGQTVQTFQARFTIEAMAKSLVRILGAPSASPQTPQTPQTPPVSTV